MAPTYHVLYVVSKIVFEPMRDCIVMLAMVEGSIQSGLCDSMTNARIDDFFIKPYTSR